MPHENPDLSDVLRALSRWDNEGGAAPGGHQEGVIFGGAQPKVHPLRNAELVRLDAARPTGRKS